MERHIEVYNHNNRLGVLVEFGAIDDFTLRTQEFRTLARDIALQIAACNPAKLAHGQEVLSLLNQRFVKDETISVRERIALVDDALKGAIRVLRYVRFAIDD